MTGTVKVTVNTTVFHPIYKKRYRRSKNFLADSNGHDLYQGDTVVITECRPLSKNKCFKVTEVVAQVPRVSDVKEEKGLDKLAHNIKEKPVEEEKVEAKEEKAEEKNDEASETDTPAES